MVNNAGIFLSHKVEETTSEEWNLVMDINAMGVFLGTKAAIPEMRKAGGGSIVNISSVAGLIGGESTAYSAGKGYSRSDDAPENQDGRHSDHAKFNSLAL